MSDYQFPESMWQAVEAKLPKRACAKCGKLNPPHTELCPVPSPEGKPTLHVFRVEIKPNVRPLAPKLA